MQLLTTDADTRLQTIRDRVSNAALCLKLVEGPEQPNVLHAVALAIDNILMAAYSGENLGTLVPEVAAETDALIRRATPIVAEAMYGKMLPERLYFLMGAARGLLTEQIDPFRNDRLNYAGMLGAELAMAFHSRMLAERGFPLLRAARMEQACAEPRDPARPLN
jgi:hypothetical protein